MNNDKQYTLCGISMHSKTRDELKLGMLKKTVAKTKHISSTAKSKRLGWYETLAISSEKFGMDNALLL